MRRLILLAALAASFALWGNAASACPNADHVSSPPAIENTDTGFYFEQAAAFHDHRAHRHGADHDHTLCDGNCCGCAASAAAALPAFIEPGYRATRSVSHAGLAANFVPRQLSGEFYGPPKSFA
jgi:hypothetical protein